MQPCSHFAMQGHFSAGVTPCLCLPCLRARHLLALGGRLNPACPRSSATPARPNVRALNPITYRESPARLCLTLW